jgi:gamma-carbonic anhydrase
MIAPFENKTPRLGADVFVAEGAHVIGDVHIGKGSSIWFNSVVRGDVHFIRIGEKTNIQDNSVVHVTGGVHPTIIGNEVTAGHRVILHGCTIEDRALIGMGAVVMDGAVVGRESMIGAGAVVTPGTQIPSGVLALGSPCKVVRELKAEERKFLEASAIHYLELAKKYFKNK